MKRMLFVTLAVLVGSLLPAPAHADVSVTYDRVGDGSNGAGVGPVRKWGDVRTVRVDHRRYNVFVTVGHGARGQLADEYVLWIDTDPANPGPEYFTDSVGFEPRNVYVYRTTDFGDYDHTAHCRVGTTRFDWRRRVFSTAVPKRCLGSPARVRVSVQTLMEYEPADWAPRERGFGPWVGV